MKSHCVYECNCSSGAQGPCSSDGARRCFMHSNREEESAKEEKMESGRTGQSARMLAILSFFNRIPSSISFLLHFSFLPLFPQHPPSLCSPILFLPPLSSLLSSSLGRISWVSLEGKCNNAPTRWNRARSIISREMDGPAGAKRARNLDSINWQSKTPNLIYLLHAANACCYDADSLLPLREGLFIGCKARQSERLVGPPGRQQNRYSRGLIRLHTDKQLNLRLR